MNELDLFTKILSGLFLWLATFFLFGYLVIRDLTKMGTCAAHEMADAMIATPIGFLWPITFPIWKLWLRKKMEKDLREKETQEIIERRID